MDDGEGSKAPTRSSGIRIGRPVLIKTQQWAVRCMRVQRVDGDDLVGFVARYWRVLAMTVFVAVALAAAYVFGGGIDLMQHPRFAAIDSYAFAIASLVGLVVPLGWYLRTRDLSETAALTLGLGFVLFNVFEDILVYLLLGQLPPAELPWLMDAPVGGAAQLLGMETVTGGFLAVFVAVTGVLVLAAMAVLYRWE